MGDIIEINRYFRYFMISIRIGIEKKSGLVSIQALATPITTPNATCYSWYKKTQSQKMATTTKKKRSLIWRYFTEKSETEAICDTVEP